MNTTVAHSVEAPASPLGPPFTDEFVRRMVATRKPTKEELRAIGSPNRHVALPSPALESVASILRDLSGELAMLGVVGIGLFGSVARGDDTPDSDVDVGVQMPSDGIRDHIRVRKLLEVNLNRRVDVVRLPFRFPLSALADDELVMVW